jgi:hypothetical protein
MRAGDKAADLGSRREGTVPILENRATAVVSWRRLREAEPRRRESSPSRSRRAGARGQRRPNEFLEVPAFWDFPVIF